MNASFKKHQKSNFSCNRIRITSLLYKFNVKITTNFSFKICNFFSRINSNHNLLIKTIATILQNSNNYTQI